MTSLPGVLAVDGCCKPQAGSVPELLTLPKEHRSKPNAMPQPSEQTVFGALSVDQTSILAATSKQEAALLQLVEQQVKCHAELKSDIAQILECLNAVLEQRTGHIVALSEVDELTPLAGVGRIDIDDGDAAGKLGKGRTDKTIHSFCEKHEVQRSASFCSTIDQHRNGERIKISEKVYWARRAKRFITSFHFEVVLSMVILLNQVSLGMQLQLQGLHAYEHSTLRGSGAGAPESSHWSNWESFFTNLEKAFNGIYVAELGLCILAFGRRYFYSFYHVFDAVIIVANAMESFYLSEAQNRNGRMKLGAFRIIRVIRVFRFAKLLSILEHAKELQLFVRTLVCSFYGVGSCMLVLGVVVSSAAVFMTQICMEFLDDESVDYERRVWLFESFGTTTRGLFTMFESTFTSHWWFYARKTTDEVRWQFALFWIPFVVLVNFSFMRILTALFVRQTMSIAEVDKERAAMEHMKQKEAYAVEITGIFQKADITKDGLLNRAEWDAMLEDVAVIDHFQKMDMDVAEVDAVFNVCSSDDDVVDFQEFLHSVMKMKGSARAIDMIQVMHMQFTMQRQLTDVRSMLSQLISLPLGAKHAKTEHYVRPL